MNRRPPQRLRLGYILWMTGLLILNVGLSLAAVRLLGPKVGRLDSEPLSNLRTQALPPVVSKQAACAQTAPQHGTNQAAHLS